MSFLGSIFGAGPNNNQKTANNQLNADAQNASNFGLGYLEPSQTNFQAPTSYYSSILSGNPADVSGALAPQISQLQSGFQQNKQQVDQFAPMGGGRAATLAQAPFQETSAITNLISNARQNAAQGLTGIAGTEGALGGGLLGTSTQAANAFDTQGNVQNQFQYQQGAQTGQALGQLIAGLA
jgi:hypothetical protein